MTRYALTNVAMYKKGAGAFHVLYPIARFGQVDLIKTIEKRVIEHFENNEVERWL